MGTTAVNDIPYPEPTDRVMDGDNAMKAIAERVDDITPVVCTAATRPPHADGRLIYEADTGRTLQSDGEDPWRLVSDAGALPSVEAFDVASVGVAANAETTIYSATLALGNVARRVAGAFTFIFDTAGSSVAGTVNLRVNGTVIGRARYHTDADNPTVPRMGSVTCVMSTGVYTGNVTVTLTLANDASSDNSLFIKHTSGRFWGVPC